jgi:hypothetical protein
MQKNKKIQVLEKFEKTKIVSLSDFEKKETRM